VEVVDLRRRENNLALAGRDANLRAERAEHALPVIDVHFDPPAPGEGLAHTPAGATTEVAHHQNPERATAPAAVAALGSQPAE